MFASSRGLRVVAVLLALALYVLFRNGFGVEEVDAHSRWRRGGTPTTRDPIPWWQMWPSGSQPTCLERESGAREKAVTAPCRALLSRWPRVFAGGNDTGASPILRAAVITSGHSHHEVGAPLACMLRPYVADLTYAYYRDRSRRWMDTDALVSLCQDRIYSVPKRGRFEIAGQLDLIVLITASSDAARFKHLLRPGLRQIWVIHHTNTVRTLAAEAASMGVLDDVLFVVLGTHALPSMRAEFKTYGAAPEWIEAHARAVFPVGPLPVGALASAADALAADAPPGAVAAASRTLTFLVAGKGEAKRRPYDGIMGCFSALVRAGKADFRLLVAGAGVSGIRSSVPSQLRDKVLLLESQPYPEYFAALAAADFVVAAVAQAEYAWERATSSVPTAVMAGTPLLMDESFLHLYPCLASAPLHAALAAGDGSYCGAVQRAYDLPPEQRREMRAEAAACRKAWVCDGLCMAAGLAGEIADDGERAAAAP